MMDLADTDTSSTSAHSHRWDARSVGSPHYNEDDLADRCMYIKEYDLLDIDRGHFWHKLSWHGVHVEFPNRLHHYEPDNHENLIRDYVVGMPADVLEDAFARLQDAPRYTLCHGDHCFDLEWDDEVQRHLHCYYDRSPEGRERDRRDREQHMRQHVEQYETNRRFPSKRLNAELEHLKMQRDKARQAVEAWDRMILQCQDRIAQDQILHRAQSNSARA